MIQFDKHNKPITIIEIQALEKLIREKTAKDLFIPKDYIDFLLKYNGEDFEDISYIYKKFSEDLENGFELGMLVSVKDLIDWVNSLDKNDSYFSIYFDALANENILTRIGFEKWGGYEISIGIGKKNSGNIFFSKLYTAVEFIKIAESFTEFLNNFEKLEE